MRIVIPVLSRLLSALCALALVAGGALIVVEVVANWTGNGFLILPTDWPDQLRSTGWDERIVRNSLLVAAAIGVLLLLVALWRRPPLTVDTNEDGMEVERRALELALRRRLDGLDGVAGSRVRVDKHRIRARVDTSRRLSPDSIRGRATDELRDFCSHHGLDLTPEVTLHSEGAAR